VKLHPTPRDFSHGRRRVLHAGRHMLLVASALARAESLRATPAIALGPFYPPKKPADSDADLTQVAGRTGRAQGTILYVTGRVLDTSGKPSERRSARAVAGQRVRPLHSSVGSPSRAGRSIPNFQGYGTLRAGSDGAVSASRRSSRRRTRADAAHPFHRRGARTRASPTQMFFEGEAGNERDGLYRYLSADDRRASTGRYVDPRPRRGRRIARGRVGHRAAARSDARARDLPGHGSPMNALERNAHTGGVGGS
jgi:protocatechuate 3,4-dioxygenase beta subunit